jgi:hypothetical protein
MGGGKTHVWQISGLLIGDCHPIICFSRNELVVLRRENISQNIYINLLNDVYK